MKFSKEKIDFLRRKIGERLSEKRYRHTLGVEKTAVFIGEKCLPNKLDELRVAALLHDVSKEYSEAEQFEIIKKHNVPITDEDIASPALWHSITAPYVVLRDFSEFADRDVLSAVANHTVGSPDMSVFDEIIMLADYIEPGRPYQMCIDVRKGFLDLLDKATTKEECVHALHVACVAALNNTISEFVSRGAVYHNKTKATRDALLITIERKKMDNKLILKNADSGTVAREAVKILIEKKALDIKLFDVREKSSITDYYVNVTGRSTTQVASLADEVDCKLSEKGRGPIRTEGRRGTSWILVDYGDVIINVFDKASRDFYSLDKHFPEESLIDISELVAEVDAKLDINKN